MMKSLIAGLMVAAADPVDGLAPGLEYSESRETYPVSGSTRRELRSALRDARAGGGDEDKGRGTAAHASQDLGMRFELEPMPDGCQFKDLVVSLDVTIHLPEWVHSGSPPKSIAEDWRRMRDALEQHEEGHRDIAVESARHLYEGLQALGVKESCQDLRREAQRIFFRVQLRHSVRDGAYEHRTRHGIAQGSVF